MPVLEKPEWETFAQLIAGGMGVAPAYVKAGYKLPKNWEKTKHTANAFALARKPDVKARIRELQGDNAIATGVTVEKLVKELDQMIRLARKTSQAGAGVAAIMGKAKLLGLVVDRAEIEGTMRRPMREPGDGKSMTYEQWAERFAPKPPTTEPSEPAK